MTKLACVKTLELEMRVGISMDLHSTTHKHTSLHNRLPSLFINHSIHRGVELATCPLPVVVICLVQLRLWRRFV